MARDVDPRSFHERAIEEGRFYERRVAEDLSNKVFGDIFPGLARAIVEAAPQTDLQEVRDGALILLYRLLFILCNYSPMLLRIPVKPITDSGVKPITQSGQADHLSERSDAGVRLCRSVIGLGQ